MKKFLKAIFLGETRTKTISFEHKELFSNIDVARQLHANMKTNKDSFELENKITGVTYTVKSVKIER